MTRYSVSQEPYPRSVRIRWFVGRFLRGAWRALLLLVSVAAVAWTGAFIVGCSGLKDAIEEVSQDPTLEYSVPSDWEKPPEGENGAPYFAASYALLAYTYPAQAAAIEKVGKLGWDSVPEEGRAALRAWLKEQQIAFDLASKGADKPGCRYSREWWADRARTVLREPWRISIPELEGVEQLSGALVALAHSRLAEGKAAEARDAIRIAIKVADSLRDDPFLQSQGRRIGQLSMILDNVTELVPAASSAEDLEAWLKVLPAPEAFDGVLERAGKWILKERVDIFCGGADRYWFWQRMHYRWGPMDFSKMLRKRLADPLFEADAIRCLEDTRSLVAIWGKPYLEAKPEAAHLEKKWKSVNETRHPTAPLIWHLSPALRLDRVQVARARLALVRTGLEWELTKATKGVYPATPATVDPLTGDSFKLEAGPNRLTGAPVPGYEPKMSKGGRVFASSITAPNTWILRAK